MASPPLPARITFARPSPWVWQVSLDGEQVGTVNGDPSCGFTARDLEQQPIGHGFISADAAMQACVAVLDSH